MAARKPRAQRWLGVTVRCTPETEEAVSYLLFRAGALGCEQREGQLLAYFPECDAEALLAELREGLQNVRAAGLAVPDAAMDSFWQENENWHEGWRQYFKPIVIGGQLVVRPPWEPVVEPRVAVHVVIEPKQAFGTGHHATTKLMLAAIVTRRHALPKSTLDVGTGSGILAIAHALFCPESRVIGCDLDPVAIENAVENAAINNVAPRTHFFVGSLEALAEKRFPLIYANLQRHIILPILDRLTAHLTPAGELLLSGVLAAEESLLRDALAQYPLTVTAVRRLEEWILLEVKKQ